MSPEPAVLIYLNFQALEVVSRYRDPQLQVPEIYLDLLNLSTIEFTIVIFNSLQAANCCSNSRLVVNDHYKPRIAVAILDL